MINQPLNKINNQQIHFLKVLQHFLPNLKGFFLPMAQLCKEFGFDFCSTRHGFNFMNKTPSGTFRSS